MATDHVAASTASSTGRDRDAMAGILTKTIVQSPVVRWILHARIRHRRYNDVVFVGSDFIHVKQVKERGHLEHVATKTDFDARIRAAKAFSNSNIDPDEDLFIKSEDDNDSRDDLNVPPQCLALTLESPPGDLVFVYLAMDGIGGYRFVQQAIPLPRFDRTLFQPGEHLAVDPQSRALAVAANETEVVIYSAKAKERIRNELRTGHQDWCPVSAQRPLQVEGVIEQMDFLIPSTNSNDSDDGDHIILLLIVADDRRTRAVLIEWYSTSDLHHAHIHDGQTLESVNGVSTLLIPLLNAAFLLIHGSEIRRWSNILSGSATCTIPGPMSCPPSHPGASPRRPLWANWCRPLRGQAPKPDTDYLYLVREDGPVYLIEGTKEQMVSSNAGSFDCHVGSAFASLGGSRDPDILAVAGDMSSGRVHTIGKWFTPVRVHELSRSQTMEMALIESIPNWASVTDMVTSALPGKSRRARDGVFVTSCRQPYGAITELRHGLEARLSVYFELDGLRSVTDLWALPLAAVGHILLVLSSPSATRLLDVSADADMESIEEVDGVDIALDAGHRTLAAAATADGKIVQVTDKSICVSAGVATNFEDCARKDCVEGSTIVAAAIDTSDSVAVTAESTDGGGNEYALVRYELRTDDSSASGEAQIERTATFDLPNEPLCLALAMHSSGIVAFVANAEAQLEAYAIERGSAVKRLGYRPLPCSPDGLGMCDSLTVLYEGDNASATDSDLLVVCGLRDGRLYAVSVKGGSSFQFGDNLDLTFSHSTVKLTQSPYERSLAYAVSGLDTCLLSWSGRSASSLAIQSIWTTDKLRPELAQGAVAACARIPPAHLLSSPALAGSLVMISGDDFLVTSLDRRPGAVPRQIHVGGTPNRLIYAEQQRCLVCASQRYETRLFPSSLPHAKPEERRQIWPVVDFVPSRSSVPSFTYDMRPGERVFALLEWSFKAGDDKVYSFIMVGGSYIKSNGSQGGRIIWLQPVNRSWEVVDAEERRSMKFDAPVYALALFNEYSFLACVGQNVMLYSYSIEHKKWRSATATPFKLGSPGTHITTSGRYVCISTTEDSIVTLYVASKTADGADNPSSDEEGDDGAKPEYYWVRVSMGPRAEALLSHVFEIMPDSAHSNGGLGLVATKHGQIIGHLTHRELDEGSGLPSPRRTHMSASELLFEAQLPRSLTRLRQCNVRPRWKAGPPAGVHIDNILGCAADGTLVGVAVLEKPLWRRLSWLQRLCEWSEELSPHSCQDPVYRMDERTYGYLRKERAMPIGLREGSTNEIMMSTSASKLADGHINGDVLARVLKRSDAVDALSKIITHAAQRDDRAGKWLKDHLEEELEAVEDFIQMLSRLLDCWL